MQKHAGIRANPQLPQASIPATQGALKGHSGGRFGSVAKVLPRVATVTVRGETKWVVDYREGGKRRRLFRDTKAKADALADSLKRTTAKGKKQWAQLSAADQYDLIEAFRLAKAKNLDLGALIAGAKQGAESEGPKLSDVIDELVKVKLKAGKSVRYTDNLRIVLGLFAKGREGMRIARVSLAHVETFLDSRSLSYRPTLRARISSLFKFSIRRGYRLDNPCAQLEPITVPRHTPHIFTVTQTAKALLWLAKNRPKVLAWFVLSTFCGLRPEEAEKTTAKEINFKEGFVRVEAQTTKVRQRRVVYPKKEAMALLKAALKVGALPLNPHARRYALDGLCERLHFKHWPKDITRHTAASYWLADTGSAEHVSEHLGNSEDTLRRNYKAAVTREHAKQFWQLAQRMSRKVRF